MNESTSNENSDKTRTLNIVIFYPFALLIIGVFVNLFLFGVDPIKMAFPNKEIAGALIISAALLLINHSWIMTVTALKRVQFKIHSTPEEWEKSGQIRKDVSEEGYQELERCHNTHRNTTENTVYFVLIVLIYSIISPPVLAAEIWIICFAVARLGYTFSFFSGNDDARGVFMSLSLLSLYGIASYIVMSLIA